MAQLHVRSAQHDDNVRIGPISLFTLIIVICLAVLAVLTFATANATYIMTQRQATATTELYLDEQAAQEFIAGVSDVLQQTRSQGGSGQEAAQAVEEALVDMRDAAQASSDGQVTVTASVDDMQVNAQFQCENGRMLTVVATIRDDCSYRIDKWKMTAVQNEEEPAGNLWTGE